MSAATVTVKRLSSQNMLVVQGTMPDHTTEENDYADVGAWECDTLKTKALGFEAKDNDLQVRILGSLDGGETYPHTAQAEFDVDAGEANAVRQEITDYYTDLQVQAKPKVAGEHGTLSTQVAGASF